MESYDSTQLTDNFYVHEFLVSRDYPALAAMLTLDDVQVNNLFLLCATILQPARDHLNIYVKSYGDPEVSIIVSSGYRDPVLNAAVGGYQLSLHKEAKAADIRPSERRYLVPLYRFMEHKLRHAWVQLILYHMKGIIHVALPHPEIIEQCEERQGG